MKIRVQSNGNKWLLKIVNAETGEPIEGLIAVKWEWNVKQLNDARVSDIPLILTFIDYELEVEGEAETGEQRRRVSDGK